MPRVRKPSPQDFSPPKLCGGKRSYPTKHEAERVKEEQELLQYDLKLDIYRCQSGCRGWHLTRQVRDHDQYHELS